MVSVLILLEYNLLAMYGDFDSRDSLVSVLILLEYNLLAVQYFAENCVNEKFQSFFYWNIIS